MADKGKEIASVEDMGVRELIAGPYKKEFARALPRHMKPDRFIRIALTAITKNPKLLQCTKASLMGCLLDLSQLGLEPDGRRAHLIPYNDRKNNTVVCTLIVDYKGLVELAMNAGDVANIHADVVCDEDVFVYDKGEVVQHAIDFRKPRGKMYAAYCIITMKDGTKKCEVMTKEDVDSIRGRSKAKDSGPWCTDYNEMAKKTVFRRASKWIKLSPELREKIETDDQVIDLEPSGAPELPGKPEVAMPTSTEDAPQIATVPEAPAPITEMPAGGCTEAQQQEIETLAKEKDENLPALLGGFGFEQVKQLAKKDADNLIGYLKNKKAKVNA